MTPEHIIEKFNKGLRKDMVPVIATAFTTSEGSTPQGKREMVVTFKHIPTSDFRSFILFDDKSEVEVLQKYIISKSDRNSVIK